MITYIEIGGYKSIKSLQIELNPVNLLIGANGVGKSNFLSFFNLLNSIFNKQLKRFVLEEDKADKLLFFGRKNTESLMGKVIFSRDGGETNNAYRFNLIPSKSGELFINFEGSGYNVEKNEDTNNWFYNENLEESEIADSEKGRNKWLRSYLSSIQLFHFHDTTSESKLRQPSDIEDNYLLKSDGRNLAAYLYYLKSDHPKIYKRIVKVVKSVAPFIHEIVLRPKKKKKHSGLIEIRWVEKTDLNSNFSAYQFSDGTLRFIALATTLLQPNPPSVIIIDEPELGLHPFAISKLAGLIQIASNRTQIIVSTQSVNLVDCFNPEDIITVDREQETGQSIFKRLDSSQLSEWLGDHKLGELWQRDIINSAQPYMK